MPISSSGGRLSISIELQTNAEGVVQIVSSKLKELSATIVQTNSQMAVFKGLPLDALRTASGQLEDFRTKAERLGTQMPILAQQTRQALSGLSTGAPTDIT